MRGVAALGAGRAFLAGALIVAAASAQAQEAGAWRLQGFGGWAFGKTDNDNTYAYLANGDGNYNNYDFALNLAAQPTKAIALRSQVVFGEDLRGRQTDVDYVFAEWTHSPRFRARAGKVLMPFGLYTEIYEVGTLRPFYLLPQFYSGSSGLMPKSYLGGGVTGVIPMGETWEFGYDVFAGEVHFQEFPSNVTAGMDPGTGIPVIRDVTMELIGRNMIGGRVLVGAPSKGLQVGAGLLRADVEQRVDEGPRAPFPVAEDAELAQLQLQYVWRGFTLRSEYFHAFVDTSSLARPLRRGLVQDHRNGGRWRGSTRPPGSIPSRKPLRWAPAEHEGPRGLRRRCELLAESGGRREARWVCGGREFRDALCGHPPRLPAWDRPKRRPTSSSPAFSSRFEERPP